MTETIRVPSTYVRAAFRGWLARAYGSGIRLVVLEGLSNAGKSHLLEGRFMIGGRASTCIQVDRFLRRPVLPSVPYPDAVDRAALRETMAEALASSTPIVVVEGPMAWPLVDPVPVGSYLVRRVYLKRMMRLRPDIWCDEDRIGDEGRWPPGEYHRAIYRYHAERRPWLDADLVLERIDDQ
jgi:hypothetical protein